MNRLSLISTFGRVVSLLIGVLFGSIVYAQTNPSSLDFNLKQGTTATFSIESTSTPYPVIDLDFDWGYLSQPTESVNGEYEIMYTAPTGYEGSFSFLIEYTGTQFFPFLTSYTRYTQINVNVSTSLIETTDDVVLYDGQQYLDIQPSLNDVYSDGPLTIEHIAHTQQGSAVIEDDKTVRYTPPADFAGRDIINYIVKDEIGNKGNGVIYIVSESQNTQSDTIYLIVSSENDQYLFLPKKDMSLISHTGGNGNISLFNEMAAVFSPIPGRSGQDVVVYSDNNGYNRTIIIKIIDNAPDADVVKDDKVYTTVGNSITFDVSENDLIGGGSIVYASPELIDLGDGTFQYDPPPGFVGFKEFVYRVNTGSQILTGNIQVKIDNYYPKVINYEFEAYSGKPLVLNYDVPIDGYSFNILSSPAYGDLEYFNSQASVNLECGTVDIASVIYTPIESFQGQDEFDLQYCIEAGQCKVIKVKVNVNTPDGDDCVCVENCVWPGDTDANGIVSFSDMLAIGYYMGETGPAREEINTSWTNQSSDEWLKSQVSGTNLKHVDSNGDGMITNADTASVINNFGSYHSFIPSSIQVLKKSPIILIPRTTEVDSGDVMVIDIALGNDASPVLDIHGLTFQMRIPPGLIDSASADISFHDDSWLSDGFGIMQDFIQPSEGVINSVITRTDGLPKSGDGIIGTTTFIVEDEVNGFRLKEGETKLPFDIDITDILAYDSYGQSYTLPLTSAQVFLNIQEDEEPEITLSERTIENQLFVFPNPAKDVLQVHLNGKEYIKYVRIYDMMGRKIMAQNNLREEHMQIDVSELLEGLYILEVSDGVETTTQKIKISR